MDEERKKLTIEEATTLLPDSEQIHTFMNPAGGMMIGADRERSVILEMFNRCGVEKSGKTATAMKHGLVSIDKGRAIFVETRP